MFVREDVQEKSSIIKSTIGLYPSSQERSLLRKKTLLLCPPGRKPFQELDILLKIQEYLQNSP